MREASFGQGMIKGAESLGETLDRGVCKHFTGLRSFDPVKGEGAAQNLACFYLGQLAEKVREERNLVALRDDMINGEFNAKNLANPTQPFLPVAAIFFETLRIR